jgi:hypothetical protein
VDNFRWCVGGLAGLCGLVGRLKRSYQNYMVRFLLVGMIFACVQLAQLLLEFRAGMVPAISKVSAISK